MALTSRFAAPRARSQLMKDLELAEDYLQGVGAIAAFLGPAWTERKIYHARETGALPIRKKAGIGFYAFKSELLAKLKRADTLPAPKGECSAPRCL